MGADEVISKLHLIPLPNEGGWFRKLHHLHTKGMAALLEDMGAVAAWWRVLLPSII